MATVPSRTQSNNAQAVFTNTPSTTSKQKVIRHIPTNKASPKYIYPFMTQPNIHFTNLHVYTIGITVCVAKDNYFHTKLKKLRN